MIRSRVVWALTWLYMLGAGLVCLPYILITGKLDLIYFLARGGCRLLLALAGVRVVTSGTPPANTACLYMANHQSNLDPPVLLAHLPGEISFLAKKELFSIPVLGWVLRVGGLIPVDRGNRDAARAGIALAAQSLRAGRPFLVFPEGTRTRDGHLQEFKKGPFFLAEQA
ncbi:MAG: lysophospholipid acyltransferase family protein, partial [Terriglobales bacterium]